MPRKLTRSQIRIYGTLSALGRDSGHILDRLAPFFEPILRQHNGKMLKPDEIAADIRSTYNWNFSADIVETFVPHLKDLGWIVPDIPSVQQTRRAKTKRPIRPHRKGTRITTYTIQMEENGDPYASLQNSVEDLHKISVQFKQFADELSPLTSIPQQVNDYSEMLVNWLLYVEALNEGELDASSNINSNKRKRNDHKITKDIEETSLSSEAKYLCARFVEHVIKTDQSSAQLLVGIASAGLLAEVVQDFVKPDAPVKKTNLFVYLDTPLAMELLGVSGELSRESIAPAVDELHKIGASVQIFSQSIKEIQYNLQNALNSQFPAGPTARAIARGEVLKEFVREVLDKPESCLEELGVKTVHREIDKFESDSKYFTEDNMLDLDSKLSNYWNAQAREHDVAIVTLVARQRKNDVSNDIFKSQAIVLTRNNHLVSSARDVYADVIGRRKGVVPPVIHRRMLVTALWLRTGMGSDMLELPKRMLLASCERVLAIRPEVADAVKRLTDKADNEEKIKQLNLMASQYRSTEALMDKTLGDVNVVTEENISELWQEMLNPYLEEVKSEGKSKLDKAKKKIASQNAELDVRIRDDRAEIMKLCEDIERTLGRNKMFRIGIGAVLALIATVLPFQFESEPIEFYITLFYTWLAYFLAFIGGGLFRITVNENDALAALQSEAERRRISRKLGQFDFKWNGKAFTVKDRIT